MPDEDLTEALSDHLEIIDKDLRLRGVEIDRRPMLALINFLLSGDVELRFGDDIVDISKPQEHAKTEWFKAFYAAVEKWYERNYGAERTSGSDRRNNIQEGAVLIRNEAYSLMVPTNRRKVEVEGEQAWMYFDEGLEQNEDPLAWIVNAPKLDGLSKKDRRSVKSDAEKVASTLRFIEFRRVTGNKDKRNIRAQELIEATLVYLKLAAKRMTTGDRSERIMAWFDLQMAAESALKAAIQQASDAHPRVHPLNDLLRVAEIHGVKFDSSRLREWPNFKSMSDYRYGKGDPGGNEELFAAYLLTLDLARSAIDTIEPGLQSGFGVLLQYPPWKSRPEC